MKPRLASILVPAVVLAACEETAFIQPDAADQPDVDSALSGPIAVVVSGNDTTGIMSVLDVQTLKVTQNVSPAGGVGNDPLLRRFGDKLYVINRYSQNSVSVYDARTLAFEEQYGAGPGSNAQDVAVVGDYLYVTTAGNVGMTKIHARTGAKSTIDLATPLGDPDGNPDCVSGYVVGSRVFVACGLFDQSFNPRSNGKIAVIDTANGDAVSVVTLPATNPQPFIVQTPASSVFGGDLLVPLTPSFTDYSVGCIARVSTGSPPTASCAAGLANSQLEGIIAHLDITPDSKMMWMAVTSIDASFTNPTGTLRAFDLTEGSMWPRTSPTAQLIVDTAACTDGSIVALDRKKDAAGIRVYRDNVEVTTAPLPVGLPPLFGNNTVCYDPAAL